MQSLLKQLVVVGTVALAGCAGAAGGDSEGADGQAAEPLVMLDKDARAAGFALITPEGRVSSATPVALDGDVVLVGPGQRIPLSGAPGELLTVRGAHGALVSRAIGSEVDTSRVVVDGDEASVRALAHTLGDAKITGEGPFTLAAPDLVAKLVHASIAASIRSIEAVAVTGADAAARGAAVASAPAVAAATGAFSAADARFAQFGALGASSPTCEDPALGTWVSTPKYYPQYDDWYVFTMRVGEGADDGQLAGTIDARTWSGDGTLTEPPECGGEELNLQVSMPARGQRTADGGFSFSGASWALHPSSCTGLSPRYTGYNPDKFSGRIDGGALRSVNNDGGRSVNDPVGFERVSCE
jgi:hypothetical protein